jgi:hypothetical protein
MLENNNEKNHDENKGHELKLTINGQHFEWHEQYITGSQIRKLGKIPKDDVIILEIKRPWEDEIIKDADNVDLARPGIEHFISIEPEGHKLVSIFINRTERKVKRGKYTVTELKTIGEVPLSHELEELISGKLTPLDDNSSVLIKGMEQFFSHVRDGSSS